MHRIWPFDNTPIKQQLNTTAAPFKKDSNITIKLTLIGPACSGKTALANYLTQERSLNEEYEPTIGASFKTKYLATDWSQSVLHQLWRDVNAFQKRSNNIEPPTNDRIQIEAWDCAGLERFWSLIHMYLHRADIVYFVCDMSQLIGSGALEYIDKLRELQQKSLAIYKDNYKQAYFIGTKSDLLDEKSLAKATQEFLALAQEFNIDKKFTHITSAKDKLGVDNLLMQTITKTYAIKTALKMEHANTGGKFATPLQLALSKPFEQCNITPQQLPLMTVSTLNDEITADTTEKTISLEDLLRPTPLQACILCGMLSSLPDNFLNDHASDYAFTRWISEYNFGEEEPSPLQCSLASGLLEKFSNPSVGMLSQRLFQAGTNHHDEETEANIFPLTELQQSTLSGLIGFNKC